MNFAYIQATKDKANTVISFFFHARGDSLERSTAGMYRSLLFQLLNALPELQGIFGGSEHQDELDSLYETIVSQSGHPVWKVGVLQDLLRRAIGKLDQQCLILFVDALDECDEDQVEEMVEYFEDLGQSATSSRKRLLICFSSRHYPHIDIQYGRKLTLERQEGHEKDIATYIQSKLKVGKSKTAGEIKTKMQIKADGIFMWAVLVVDILNQDFKDGRIFKVRKRLDELPTKLSDLFKQILWRGRKNLKDLRLCIQWILFAKRPLKVEEYYFAAVSGLSPDELSEWDPEEVTREDMGKFVLSSSKGLAEITKATKARSSTVQFIHESVRKFFLEDGLSELWPNLTVTDFKSISHGQLQQCCYAYIMLDISKHVPSNTPFPKAPSPEAKHLRSVALDKFPFLEYATHHILYHSEAAADGSPQDKFLEDFPLETWIHRSNIFKTYPIRRYTPTANLLYILAENNFPRLIKTALRLDSRVHIKGERYRYPFFAALANGHRDAIKALLQKETSNPQDDTFAHLECEVDFKPPKDQTPLSWAVENGHELFVMLLLEKEVDVNVKNANDQTLLSLAAEKGHESVVRFLLDNGADPNVKAKNDRTPLSFATEKGHESIVKILIGKGADLDAKDKNGWTPLLWAVASTGNYLHAHKRLLNLPRYDVTQHQPEAQGHAHLDHQMQLMFIEWHKKSSVIKAQKEQAMAQKLTDIVKLLLENGANAGVKDQNNQTPLSLASMHGCNAIVELLQPNLPS